MKQIASPVALTILISTPALADDTHASPAMPASYTEVTAGVQQVSQGAAGTEDNLNGGSADAVTYTNNSAVSLTPSSSDTLVIGVRGASIGGAGYTPQHHDNGGYGGNGSQVNLTNSAGSNITISAPTSPGANLQHGVIGLLGSSRGGDGAMPNSAVIDYYGGTGGSAANVTVNSAGTVALGTASAYLDGNDMGWGVVAQSIGGKGGDETKGENSDGDPSGSGGYAGSVSANVTGDVAVYWSPTASTACSKAFGVGNCSSVAAVVASSVGGTGGQNTWTGDVGGNGGYAAQATANVGAQLSNGAMTNITAATSQATRDNSAAILAMSVGGHGGGYGTDDGNGGDGGNSTGATANVSYTNVQTIGDSISGVQVLSQGGNGGSDAYNTHADDSNGGDGGAAGTATATLASSAVTTSGSMSYGVLVQSIGGLGGLGSKQGGQGAGGYIATANLDSGSSVQTRGDYAAAVVTQSLAGAGGSGGAWTSWIDGDSGDGGVGGSGGKSIVNTSATLGTIGQYAHGVLVQSIGGSGGTGATAGGVVALGGSGGGGGNGGAVTGNLGGTITTAGTGAIGGLVQSIGGGGGNAGSASGVISVGGKGGSASTGSTVDITLSGGISTSGEAGIGILGQSIGGGGGNAGSAQGVSAVGGQGGAGGDADTVNISMQSGSSIQTSGLYAHGAVAQSVGGGGGNGGSVFSLSLGSAEAPPALGGSGSGGGRGDVVEVLGSGAAITTTGAGSIGVLAQSIGGGGGTGGSSMQEGLDFASLAIGGAGAQGGNSGNVTVGLENSTVSTLGSAAPAITAQSIGGGGGNGGAAHGSSVNVFFGTDITIGGSAGNGGGSGTVAIGLKGSTVTTAGGQSNTATSDSYGVLAQAIGGGGGNGGSAQASNLDIGVPTGDGSIAISTTLAMGGSGGNGGSGGILQVGLENGTKVSTGGTGSHGVLAQTIGGGGGAGGASHAMSTTSTAAPDDTLQIAVSVALGGSGGSGGHGGQVEVYMDGTSSITTNDDFSNAMMAQSIGGGGGNAGVGSSKTGGSGQLITATIGVGGTGGSGGYGGAMTAQLEAGSLLQTFGSGSRGMLLQSIGGGGGASQGGTVKLSAAGSGGDDDDDDGYSASVQVSVGASGATAGDGGAVTVVAQGAIRTVGGDADGILAQSIGGGGGLAGSAGSDAGGAGSGSSSAAALLGDDDDDSNSYGLQLSVGGRGGIGGGGGDVSLNDFTGTIATHGTYADGIVLQSIGGGGGTGGTATASGVTGATNVTMAVGGQGGAAGNGGTVIIDLQGDGTMTKGAIATQGDVAYGLLAQSIGGGGGQGADGSANTAQSGDSTSSVTLGASGASPNGGWGGKINTGGSASVVSVSTQGFNSHAIVLQSIGGGGGTASVATVGVAGDGSTPNFDLTLGGGGGRDYGGGSSPVTASSGGHIGVEAWLNVQTTGEHAFGLVAQSIGGGGGIIASGAASNVGKIAIAGDATGQDLSGDTINITIGNDGSQPSSGKLSGISTAGAGAHGIVLQSIGGGGGIAGYTANGELSAGWNGTESVSTRGSSAGGDIVLDYTGTLTTGGDGAFGIIAQSIADGGGLAGDSAGSYAGSAYDHAGAEATGSAAGNVTIDQYGTLSVAGANAYAIFAQSDGNTDNDNAVNINVGGSVAATAATGGGVWIDGTAQTNQVTIAAGASLSAATAVNNTGTQKANVANNGSLAGNLNLGGTGAELGTVDNAGTLLKAGRIRGHVLNRGDFLVGESLGTAGAHVTGDFTQTADGTLQIGADFVGQSADVLQVDGTARLDGKIRVNSSRLMPNRPVVFLRSDDIARDAIPQGTSSLFDYSTQYSGNQATVTAGQAHFDTVAQSYGAGRNLRELGSHLQDTWERGGSEELAGVYAMMDQAAGQGGAAFTDALSSLAPGIAAAPAALKQADMARFAGSLLSCPHYEGAEWRLGESSCVWGNIAARTTSVDGSHGTSSFDASGVTYQVGIQQQIAPRWFVGVSAAYENGHIKADDGRQSLSGDTGYLGASLKYQDGPWMVAGTLAGSYGSYDSTRHIRLPGNNASAKSSPDVMSLGQRLRVAYTHNMGQAYIMPMVDLDLIYTRMPSYSEHGAGALDLDYESSDKWTAILTPGVEVGGRIDLDQGYVLRPYLNVGLSLSSTDHWDSHARLDAAPAGSRSAKSTLDAGRTFGRMTAGLQLFSGEQFDVRLQYDGLYSSQVRSHGGSLKASWRY